MAFNLDDKTKLLKIEKTVMLIVALILSEVTVSARFSLADPYAIEVVLNKPGVTYDLTVLAEMENVRKIGSSQVYSVFVYKSSIKRFRIKNVKKFEESIGSKIVVLVFRYKLRGG